MYTCYILHTHSIDWLVPICNISTPSATSATHLLDVTLPEVLERGKCHAQSSQQQLRSHRRSSPVAGRICHGPRGCAIRGKRDKERVVNNVFCLQQQPLVIGGARRRRSSDPLKNTSGSQCSKKYIWTPTRYCP
jgi:hypothetical protein